jgi:hypothetical protein
MPASRIVDLDQYRPNEKGLRVLDALEAALDAAVREMGHELVSLIVVDRLDLHEEGMIPLALN